MGETIAASRRLRRANPSACELEIGWGVTNYMSRIGLISDTHGLLRPEAIDFLQGCDRIIHAGDIDRLSVLDELAKIAPVIAVRGNNDKGAWAASIPETQLVQIEKRLLYVIHDISLIDIDPQAANIDVVVYGHSHKPHQEKRGRVLYINPGSAGPRRFKLPISAGELVIGKRGITLRIANLESMRDLAP
jgi:putative phosphoesterase